MLVQKIRPSIRLLCGGVGAIFLFAAYHTWLAGYGLGQAVSVASLAGGFMLLALFGFPEDDGEPPGSERFHELADPERSLAADDFEAPARDPVRHPRTRP
jgi:hypothetical protein